MAPRPPAKNVSIFGLKVATKFYIKGEGTYHGATMEQCGQRSEAGSPSTMEGLELNSGSQARSSAPLPAKPSHQSLVQSLKRQTAFPALLL